MKVVISNAATSNGGDAAILLGTIARIHAAFGSETTIAVFSTNTEAVKHLYPDIDFRPRLFTTATRVQSEWQPRRFSARVGIWRMLAGAWCMSHGWTAVAKRLLGADEIEDLGAYADADLVVSSGGTYLVEHYSLEPAILDFAVTRMLRRPLVLFTQSLGPFVDHRNRRRLGGLLRKAEIILVRDEPSRQNLFAIGVPGSKIHLGADAAFGLEIDDDVRVDEPMTSNGWRVSVSVRSWQHFRSTTASEGMRRYRASMAAAVSHLVTRYGASVRFLSTCQGVPGYWTDDSVEAASIVKLLPENVLSSVEVVTGFHRPEDLVACFRHDDFVISTRMHGGILALLARTPVLPIAYEFKTAELFGRMGLAEWVQDIEALSPESLIERVDALVADRGKVRETVAKAVEVEMQRARETEQLLRDAVRRGVPQDG